MEKQSLQKFQEFSEEKLTRRVVFKRDGSTAFVLNLMPGQELPKHNHPGMQVYIIIVEGKGLFTIDGQEIAVMKNDLVNSSDQEQLSFINDSTEKTSLYVVLTKAPSEK